MIAVWDYIGSDATLTQSVNGVEAPNLLNQSDVLEQTVSGVSTASTWQELVPQTAPITSAQDQPTWGQAAPEESVSHPTFPTIYELEQARALGLGVGLSELIQHSFISTRLSDGRPGLLIDIGSIGNLAGDKWARTVSIACGEHGMRGEVMPRSKALTIHGVGTNPDKAHNDVKLPIGLQDIEGDIAKGNVTMPVIERSDIPGLLGLASLRERRTIIDLNNNRLYFAGPGGYDLEKAMPPGTDVYQCESSPSGHMLLPCCNYKEAKDTDPPLVLHSKSKVDGAKDYPTSPPSLPPPEIPAAAEPGLPPSSSA